MTLATHPDAHDLRRDDLKATLCSLPYNQLLTLDQIPRWMRDNDYLRTGYRPPQPSLLSCFRTGLLRLTNETFNIYTHLVGFLILIPIGAYLLGKATSDRAFVSQATCASPLLNITLAALRQNGLINSCALIAPRSEMPALNSLFVSHRMGMAPLVIAAIVCLAFSWTYHTFWVLSPRALSILAKLDFIGIACLCVGHGWTGVYYTFYCKPEQAFMFYAVFVTLFVLTIPAILSPWFGTPKARAVRGLLFGSLGSCTLIPIISAAWSLKDFGEYIAVLSSLVALIVYGIGACIYVSRFPECCRLGRHDTFLSSHQLMHTCVLVGIAIHLGACYYLLDLRVKYGCSLPT